MAVFGFTMFLTTNYLLHRYLINKNLASADFY